MRALHFAKIDYIKSKQQVVVLPLILLLASAIMYPRSGEDNFNVVTLYAYMLFMMTVFTTTPFGTCRREETGFLQLLPAATRDRVTGRFLYGGSLMAIAVVSAAAASLLYRGLGYQSNAMDRPLCLICFAGSMLLMTMEYLFFYLFGENKGQNLLGVVRVLPGMCTFFAISSLSGKVMEDPGIMASVMETIGGWLPAIGWGSVAVSLIVFVTAIEACVRVTGKRDY